MRKKEKKWKRGEKLEVETQHSFPFATSARLISGTVIKNKRTPSSAVRSWRDLVIDAVGRVPTDPKEMKKKSFLLSLSLFSFVPFFSFSRSFIPAAAAGFLLARSQKKACVEAWKKKPFCTPNESRTFARQKRRPGRETKNPGLPFLLQPFSCAELIPASAYWTITLFLKNDQESFITLPFLKKDFLESTLG